MSRGYFPFRRVRNLIKNVRPNLKTNYFKGNYPKKSFFLLYPKLKNKRFIDMHKGKINNIHFPYTRFIYVISKLITRVFITKYPNNTYLNITKQKAPVFAMWAGLCGFKGPARSSFLSRTAVCRKGFFFLKKRRIGLISIVFNSGMGRFLSPLVRNILGFPTKKGKTSSRDFPKHANFEIKVRYLLLRHSKSFSLMRAKKHRRK